tara:strand:- start:1502 stop:1675 length:174 start_codon:yes stop_codon:yes gene_type:complete
MNSTVYAKLLAQLQGFLSIIEEEGITCDQVLEIDLSQIGDLSVETLACEVLAPLCED